MLDNFVYKMFFHEENNDNGEMKKTKKVVEE